MLVSFAALNIGVLAAAPLFDSNFLLMSDINDKKWEDGADVLFLGDSRTHQGVIPNVFSTQLALDGIAGTDAANLARPGQQLPFAYLFASKVVSEADRKPKAVVLNISFYLLGGQQWMNDIYFAYYRPSLQEMQLACNTQLLPCGDAASWGIRTRLPALMFRPRVNTLLKKFMTSPNAALSELAGIQSQRDAMRFELARGYMSRGDDHILPAGIVKPHGYRTGIENGYSVYLAYFERMVDELMDQGIEVFVYQFPWPEQREDEPGFKDVLAYYDTLLASHSREGLHFLPTHRFWSTDYFIDPLHLNEPGAQRLSRELADDLAKNPAFQRLFANR